MNAPDVQPALRRELKPPICKELDLPCRFRELGGLNTTEYDASRSNKLRYLLSVDEKSFKPYAKWGPKEGKGMGNFHPIAWYQEYDGGRAFYTGLGHLPATYSDANFLHHVYGGIYWAATDNEFTPN